MRLLSLQVGRNPATLDIHVRSLSSSMTMKHPKPWWPLLPLLLLQLQLVAMNSIPAPVSMFANRTTASPEAMSRRPCSPEQALALLHLKQSFSASDNSALAFRSWSFGTDCCHWEGVRCGGTHAHAGRVTSIDLGDRGLESHSLDPALFELTSLRYLNLGGNDFNMSEISSIGFERLTRLTHLNLSTSNFAGQVPHNNIGRLTNLVSLDLSFRLERLELLGMGYRVRADSSYPGQLLLSNLSALLANLESLRELHLSFVDLSNGGEEWCTALSRYTPNLRVLSMPYCELSSSICGSLSRLRSLRVIDLQFNHLSGPFPDFFANFSSLSFLRLSYNYLGGWVPPAVFQHKKIVTIDVQYNFGISGNLPNFSIDSNLENLLVGATNFSGAIPSSISNLKSLKRLDLHGCGFAGNLPSTIGHLRTLTSLQVSGLGLVGPLPPWIANLTSLVVLEFSRCGLHGPIPSSVGGLIRLRKLALYNCRFSGEIPPHILNSTQLDTIQLHSNNFIGKVELSLLFKLPCLFELDLSNNKLVLIDGEDNSSLVSFPNIMYLRLQSCNIKTFPNALRHLRGIHGLDLSNNQIHGAIPQWAWEQWTGLDLFFLNLSHNKFTNVGYDTFLPFSIYSLDLSFNMFEGQIPIPQNSGIVLDYSSNHFSSMPFNISTQLAQTSLFKASRNRLSGKIQPCFCGTDLEVLDLSYNYLSGSIPSCLMEDANSLKVLNLRENQLHGELPLTINRSCMLEMLDFSGNWIEGDLPRSLGSCKYLEVLDAGNNQMNGLFPCWMTTLSRLQVLVLKHNKFIGGLAPSVAKGNNICEFPSLRILDLASNNFSGTLTKEWLMGLKSIVARVTNETSVLEYEYGRQQVYQLSTILTYKGSVTTFTKILRTLVFIDVSNNKFHGSIPTAIGELILVHGLNLSHNLLTGVIPPQIARLNQLEVLDLSSNELSGAIPHEIASLDFLTVLNLSYNKLEGSIPESPHFLTFSNSSFLGNDGLCGPPLSKGCSNTTIPNVVRHLSKKNSADVMLFLFAGMGFGIGFAIAVVVTCGIQSRKRF